MDLQKEREAFEATQNPIVFERIVYIEKANLFTMKDDFRDDLFTVNKCNELNFGWSIWQAAKAHEAEKLKGCVVVPVELSESIAEKLALEKVEKPRQENDVVWQEIADRSYKDHLIQKKWEIIRNYKELVEAVRGGNE